MIFLINFKSKIPVKLINSCEKYGKVFPLNEVFKEGCQFPSLPIEYFNQSRSYNLNLNKDQISEDDLITIFDGMGSTFSDGVLDSEYITKIQNKLEDKNFLGAFCDFKINNEDIIIGGNHRVINPIPIATVRSSVKNIDMSIKNIIDSNFCTYYGESLLELEV